jgi:hypothetical protein
MIYINYYNYIIIYISIRMLNGIFFRFYICKVLYTRNSWKVYPFLCYFSSGDLIHVTVFIYVKTEITVSKTKLRHSIKKFPKRIRKTVDTLKVLITTIPFNTVPLGENTVPPFLQWSEAVLEALLCQHFQHLPQFSQDLVCHVKSSPPSTWFSSWGI